MLDAIRMSGRMISTTVLQRVTDQTIGPNPPIFYAKSYSVLDDTKL